MSRTQLTSAQVGDEGINRADLNVSTPGSAVIRRVIAGAGITISSTGADAGTGDVTISAVGGGGGATYSEVNVDFGNIPVRTKAFSFAVEGLTVGQAVRVAPSGNTPAGVYFDEAEFESICYVARCDVAGTLKVIANSTSAVKGQRLIQLTV